MSLGPPCNGYVLNSNLVYLAIPGTRPLYMKKQNLFVLFICNRKIEIQICSNKHETGLVYIRHWKYGRNMTFIDFVSDRTLVTIA